MTCLVCAHATEVSGVSTKIDFSSDATRSLSSRLAASKGTRPTYTAGPHLHLTRPLYRDYYATECIQKLDLNISSYLPSVHLNLTKCHCYPTSVTGRTEIVPYRPLLYIYIYIYMVSKLEIKKYKI